ncbi:hypothetical protein E3N88_09528 [Mikania micrantha]|uniref:Uncharacterized protein n=1 Tax=Mikania micrantha TaxID=192012 RepID=A0A5N6PK03_9ASTR|nr:hypothetical protein E3N88_09528 [Mikania micrantha]
MEGGALTSRDRGIRSLSRIEWEEWRQQYRCGQQFGPAHECSEGKLRNLLLGDDEIVNGNGDKYGLDAIGSSKPFETLILGNCLALEQDGILVDTGGTKTNDDEPKT